MCLLTEGMIQGVCGNPAIGEKLQLLSGRLEHTRGKKVYGYLKADVKRLGDQIVDELAKGRMAGPDPADLFLKGSVPAAAVRPETIEEHQEHGDH